MPRPSHTDPCCTACGDDTTAQTELVTKISGHTYVEWLCSECYAEAMAPDGDATSPTEPAHLTYYAPRVAA